MLRQRQLPNWQKCHWEKERKKEREEGKEKIDIVKNGMEGAG